MKATEFWTQLEKWLKQHAPGMCSLINGAANEDEIVAVESAIGLRFPSELRLSYAMHDGCQSNSGLIGGLGFMSLKDVQRNWEMWADIAADDDEDLNEPCQSVPEGAIQLKYANAGWVPFIGDSQHYIAVDFAPASSGADAQIINSGRDDEIRHVIAPDICVFFDFVIEQFDSGKISPIETSDGSAPRWLRVGESDDLLTALPELLSAR